MGIQNDHPRARIAIFFFKNETNLFFWSVTNGLTSPNRCKNLMNTVFEISLVFADIELHKTVSISDRGKEKVKAVMKVCNAKPAILV